MNTDQYVQHWFRSLALAQDKAQMFDQSLAEGAGCVRLGVLCRSAFGDVFTEIAQNYNLMEQIGGMDALQAKLAEALEGPDHEHGPKSNGNGLHHTINSASDQWTLGTRKSSPLIALSTIRPLATDWLWCNRIPRGAQIINTGFPGVGKSQQLLDAVARVTTGTPWPDGSECPRGDAILLTAEDALASTVKPRLMA